MKIYMNVNYIRGRLRYGHLEGEVNFTEEEEKEFKTLLKKYLDGEDMTDEEYNKLEDYRDYIRDNAYSFFQVDDYEIDDLGEYEWKDLL